MKYLLISNKKSQCLCEEDVILVHIFNLLSNVLEIDISTKKNLLTHISRTVEGIIFNFGMLSPFRDG